MNLSAALFQRAENSNKPNQKASAAKRDQCMNPSLSTQSAFTTKLNVRKGPALLCTAVDHACHFRSSSLVVRISYYRFNTIAGQWPLNLGSERVADHGKYLLLTILAICRRLRLPRSSCRWNARPCRGTGAMHIAPTGFPGHLSGYRLFGSKRLGVPIGWGTS